MEEEKHQLRINGIANRIKELRIKAGYTSYEDFAFEHGFARKQYWRLEKGNSFLITSLFRIIDAHGISLEEFFKGFDESETPKK